MGCERGEARGGEELQNELCVDCELLYGDERDDPGTGGAQRGRFYPARPGVPGSPFPPTGPH